MLEDMNTDMAVQASCPLLSIPTEIRLQIWTYLMKPAEQLIVRSLFIRTYYRTVFMSQHSKEFEGQLLRVCKTVTAEVLPLLYGLPHWRASCRIENLASQISIANFCLIRRMTVDVDDLRVVVDSLRLDVLERCNDNQTLGRKIFSGDELVIESRGPEQNMALSNAISSISAPAGRVMSRSPAQRRVQFANLELLEVEGHQCATFTSRGTLASRFEAHKLYRLAGELLKYHTSLSILVQADKVGTGGSDAVDLYMSRVKWRFLRDIRQITDQETIVDLKTQLGLLDSLIETQQQQETLNTPTSSWIRGGEYRQYPYLAQSSTS